MGLLITIAVLAILFLIALKLFTVKRVVVEGNELYDQKTIEDAVLNDKYSWNSLYVYLKYKVKDTKKIPFIDTMSISLDSPHTLHISVYEKGMLGYIYIPGINENAYFDKDGFVGYNGCGKTTLLSILAGAQKADRGSILYNGREASGHPRVFAEEAAYVPQENPLMEELTVRDNLLLWYRGSRKQMESDLKDGAASMLGVDCMLDRTAGKLSGGMKKRLSIACALSNHAPVLIMDEPGAALDLECKEIIRNYLREYMASGGAVILTSHELAELALCTRMCILKGGVLREIECGLSAKELISQFR